jgi:hypothetical protein
VCVRIAPRTRCLRSSPGRAAILQVAGSPFEPGRKALDGWQGNRQTRQALTPEIPGSSLGRPAHALAVPESGRFLGKEEGAGANPAEGSMQM